jgi:hypothetical protein
MYTGIALAAVKLVACVLLLYGTLMVCIWLKIFKKNSNWHLIRQRHRQCLLPWSCVVLTEMVFAFAGLVTCLAVGGGHHISVLFALGTIHLSKNSNFNFFFGFGK